MNGWSATVIDPLRSAVTLVSVPKSAAISRSPLGTSSHWIPNGCFQSSSVAFRSTLEPSAVLANEVSIVVSKPEPSATSAAVERLADTAPFA